ncbi:hypothetical protein Ciccas_003485 [Cichlidogyrus casuarinus]|uniref:Uncharacterized protein n=1 Tax=Cichlidogyrus casuarinus TaxID=1844966 RepID=A0ABD2QEB1_9PLAT
MLLLYNLQEKDSFSLTQQESGYIKSFMQDFVRDTDALCSRDEVFLAIALILGLVPVSSHMSEQFWRLVESALLMKEPDHLFLAKDTSVEQLVTFLRISREVRKELTCYKYDCFSLFSNRISRLVEMDPEPRAISLLEKLLSDVMAARLDPQTAAPALKGLKTHSKSKLPALLTDGVKLVKSRISIYK